MNALPQPPLSITAYAPGIYTDIPAEVYHRRELGVVNKGALDKLAKTPAHYKAWVEDTTEQEETPALAFGKALHMAVLEPDLYVQTYVSAQGEHPHRRPSSAQRNAKKPSPETLSAISYWDDWNARMAGKVEISPENAEKITAMRASVMRHPIAGKLFEGGRAEETVVWIDPRTGLLCKARLDYHQKSRAIVSDLKSTEDASDSAFIRSIANYRYHVQHAHYADAFAATGNELRAFLFVAVEKDPPYAVAVHCIDSEAEARGIELRDRSMDLLSQCLTSGAFPAYAPTIHRLSLPLWALRD